MVSCITTRDVRYMQPNESLVINEEGLIPYNIPIYRITRNDILNLNIVTTPKGDAAQFYSSFNTSEPLEYRVISFRDRFRIQSGKFESQRREFCFILMD